ncbi:MAG: M1 family aminopeptidase [Planctomycetota bacterium]|jgi:aminopeptidase N
MARPWPVLLLFFLPAAAQEPRFAADRPLDLRHLKLEARVDLAHRTLKGRATLEMGALRDVATIRLDAVRLEIQRVAVLRGNPAQPQPAEHAHDGEVLEIHLPRPLRRGEPAQVIVDYACVRPEAGLFFQGPTEADPDTPYQAWSQGETIDTRHWIPIFDHPNERLTSELIVTVDGDLQVLSNGKLVAAERDGATAVWHWRQEQSHVPYLITLVVGKFDVIAERWRGRTVDYWVPPGRKGDIMRSFEKTRRMLDFFSDRIGVEYPWAKYTQVVVEQFRYGGMENTSATTLNERTLHDERAHLDFRSDGLVAHELAHQWFGDLLTCRDWAHTWLNEGFASYFEALWAEHDLGPDEFRHNLLGKLRGALSAKRLPIIHRAYGHPWDQFDSRAYPKGAWVLHMLRHRLGDDVWWEAINRYVERHAHTTVETVDWRKAVEEVSGRSFERFFHDWTARPGHPVVEVRHRWHAQDKLAEVRIRQTQKEPAFHFPLKLEYRFAKVPRAFTVTHDVTKKDLRFFVPLPARPALVRVDPAFSVLMDLKEHKGRDLWLRQLREDENPVARTRAAEHFGRSRRDPDRKALADALGKEGFWGVQAEIAKALGESGGTVSRDVLLQALSLEHPKARRAVVNALGKFKDDETVATALEGLVRHGDASYYVEADAVAAWARLRPADALVRLRPLLVRDSHNEVIRSAVLRGLGEQEDPAATDLLLQWTQRGRPRPCRRAALEALEALAKSGRLEEAQVNRVVETVRGCLGPSEHRGIKTQASQTLRALGEQATPALSALEALEAHDPNPNVRRQAKETIEKIRSGAPPRLELTRLRDELRKLREANRKMQDRLDRLDRKQPQPAGG